MDGTMQADSRIESGPELARLLAPDVERGGLDQREWQEALADMVNETAKLLAAAESGPFVRPALRPHTIGRYLVEVLAAAWPGGVRE